jgi:anthranilate phosphoribosyltransferase
MSEAIALRAALARLSEGARLTEAEAEAVFELIVAGEATPAQVGAVLMAMAARGETVEELTGAVRTMRRHSVQIDGVDEAIDCCGTGGDGLGTLNISTAVAFVTAACGVKVAKHGNRSASSKSGAADVLGELGLPASSPNEAQNALTRYGLTFLFAPNHHPAMRAVAGLRRELGFRTLFNLAGPLSNPAGARRQLVGVYHERWLEPVAEALRRLASIAAWVVHGDDGLDELTITGPSQVAILADGRVGRRVVTPEDAGLRRWPLSEILGGEPAWNAAALRRLLAGETGAYRDIVLLNAAACLMVAGKVAELRAGAALAAEAIDRGAAAALLADMTVKVAEHTA